MARKILSEAEKKKQQTLLIVLIVIVIATIAILYFGIWSKSNNSGGNSEVTDVAIPEDQQPTTTADQTQPTKKQLSSVVLEEKLKTINLNVEFLSETILSFLKLHGELPVQKGTTGRPNPFTP